MKPFLNRLTAGTGLLRKAIATSVWLLLSAAVLDCGAASEAYVPLAPARSLPMDGVTYEWIGREALAQYGYEEIIKRGVQAGFLRYPDSERTNTQNFVGQTMADAASQAWPVFTQWAVTAAITSQLDSPAPGPGDVVAIGMIVVGLVHAGVVGAMVLTTTSATVTAAEEAERARCRQVNETCQQKCLPKLKHSDFGNQFHRCMRECREAAGCW